MSMLHRGKQAARQVTWRTLYPALHALRTRPTLTLETFFTRSDYDAYQATSAAEQARRRQRERTIHRGRRAFRTHGYCHPCGKWTRLYTTDRAALAADDGTWEPYWREHQLCPMCGLSSRIRAAVHVLDEIVKPGPEARIYLPEQTTRLHTYMKQRFLHLAASEYLGDGPLALGSTDGRGIRNESLTSLTFADASFDVIMPLEIFEHVPEYADAFAECARCLRPGGVLLFTVPFYPELATTERLASVGPEGVIHHTLPPEIHGDPLSPEGCLCFYHYGWDVLDALRAAGFGQCAVHTYWSEKLGYLGTRQFVFVCEKSS
jgi:predicted SAM-dependent methyltransferase